MPKDLRAGHFRKIVINLDNDLVDRVDVFATKLHITRTAAISILLTRALEASDTSDPAKLAVGEVEVSDGCIIV